MKVKKIPMRMCVGCQQMKPKKELTRIARNNDGEVFVDPTGKKAGRGAYICPQKQCLDAAIKGKRLEKALQHKIDSAIVSQLKEQIGGIPNE